MYLDTCQRLQFPTEVVLRVERLPAYLRAGNCMGYARGVLFFDGENILPAK